MRHSVAVGIIAGALCLAASPARADVGLSMGPSRQEISMDGPTEVYVVNTGDETMRFQASTMVYNDGWEPVEVGLSLDPARFKLDPGEQQTVLVRSSLTPSDPCSLYGVQASALVGANASSGVLVRGATLVHLVLRDEGVGEQACLAALPKPAPSAPVPASAVPPLAWVLLAVGLAGGLWALWVVRRRPRPGRTYGF